MFEVATSQPGMLCCYVALSHTEDKKKNFELLAACVHVQIHGILTLSSEDRMVSVLFQAICTFSIS